VDEGEPAPLGPEGNSREKVDLAPPSTRPVGEELLVEKLRAGSVEAIRHLCAEESEEVAEEGAEQSFEKLVVPGHGVVPGIRSGRSFGGAEPVSPL
jgi:hypothetical protein